MRAIAISRPFVVDASIAMCWLMPDEHEQDADFILVELSSRGGTVPGVFWYEVRNGLVINERRGRLTAADTNTALQMLGTLPLAIDPAPEENAILDLSRLYSLTFYDAAYLEVAKRRKVALATFDSRLAKAAQAEGVALIAP